jgi:hypothetical protein
MNDFDFYEGKCQGCYIFKYINELGLCEECTVKLERDLIRNRDWDYSTLTYNLTESKREQLRRDVIKQHGKKLEIIATKQPKPKKKLNKKI